MKSTDFTEKIVLIFEKLPWLNIKEVAKIMNTDYPNLFNQIKGHKKVTEKRYNQIMAALEEIKNRFPTQS